MLAYGLVRASERRTAAADIRRGATRLAHRLRSERPAAALSPTKVSVLSHLYRHGERTPGEIATDEHHQPQSLTRALAELERAGLVARRRSDTDRRESVLRLTPAGETALRDDMTGRDAWLADALGGLADAEIAVLRIAGLLMDRLADAEPGSGRATLD